jgi:monofunctional glycosyltransferase
VNSKKTTRLTIRKSGLLSIWLSRLLLLLLASTLLYQAWFLLHIVYWRTHNPVTSAFMQRQLGILRQQDAGAVLRHRWVAYEQISDHLKRAVIASEDGRFLAHNGFDFDAIEIAWKKNLKQRKWVAGGSTISQQLAKNLFLSGEKTIWRKFQEALITLMLEEFLSKQRILELYLNIIEWGEGVFGVEAAALHYFNVPASSLRPKQSAWLAAMIPSPRFYDTHRNSPRLLNKTRIILARMPASKVP